MYYIVDTDKTVAQAAADLQTAVAERQFGVLHIHNIGETLRGKGVEFAEECQVFEVCNPKQAAKVMAIDMRLNMALPCRISIYSENGQTKIGQIQPGDMLSALADDPSLLAIAKEVQTMTVAMIDAAK